MICRLKPVVTAIGLASLLSSQVVMAENDWIKGVAVDGVLKIFGGYTRDYYENDSADVIVHTALLGITAQLNPWASGRFTYKYEEGKNDNELFVDDGYVTLGDHANGLPAYVRMGAMVVPFGNFTSHMNSDPLTLVMAETAEKVLQLGFNAGGAYGSVFGFNGATQEDENNTMDHYGANVGFNRKFGSFGVDVGISYISDIGDTGAITDALENRGVAFGSSYEYTAGAGAHLIVNAGPARLILEYITALDEFDPGVLPYKSRGAEPKVWNAEIGLNFDMAGRALTFAVGYQQSEEAWYFQEARATNMPETRILGTIAMEIYENTTLSLEYAQSEDYDKSDFPLATGEDATSANMVLSVKF